MDNTRYFELLKDLLAQAEELAVEVSVEMYSAAQRASLTSEGVMSKFRGSAADKAHNGNYSLRRTVVNREVTRC